MIRAVYRNGVIYPAEPVPPEWTDGLELRVDSGSVESGFDEPSDDPDEIDRWFAELQALGPAEYEPGERTCVEAVMAEADAAAKEHVRRQMGLGT